MRILLVSLLFCVSFAQNCVVGEWSAWTSCDKVCGEGKQHRARAVKVAPNKDGEHCPPLLEYRSCNVQPCSVDCVVSEFSPWSDCNATCGWGVQRRARDVRVEPEGNGKPCPVILEYRECLVKKCKEDCEVSKWSQWTACSSQCGSGVQVRTRTIVSPPAEGGRDCPRLEQTRDCEGKCDGTSIVSGGGGSQNSKAASNGNAPRLVNSHRSSGSCKVSDWSRWGPCTEGCGALSMRRRDSPDSNGECGALEEHRLCPHSDQVSNLCCPFETKNECLGDCQWCTQDDIQAVYDSAHHIVAVSVNERGKLLTRGGGTSRIWGADQFDVVASIRHAEDCDVHEMDVIHSLHSGHLCDNNMIEGRVYVVSGKCQNGIFYVDPCGVRLSLSNF